MHPGGKNPCSALNSWAPPPPAPVYIRTGQRGPGSCYHNYIPSCHPVRPDPAPATGVVVVVGVTASSPSPSAHSGPLGGSLPTGQDHLTLPYPLSSRSPACPGCASRHRCDVSFSANVLAPLVRRALPESKANGGGRESPCPDPLHKTWQHIPRSLCSRCPRPVVLKHVGLSTPLPA